MRNNRLLPLLVLALGALVLTGCNPDAANTTETPGNTTNAGTSATSANGPGNASPTTAEVTK